MFCDVGGSRAVLVFSSTEGRASLAVRAAECRELENDFSKGAIRVNARLEDQTAIKLLGDENPSAVHHVFPWAK